MLKIQRNSFPNNVFHSVINSKNLEKTSINICEEIEKNFEKMSKKLTDFFIRNKENILVSKKKQKEETVVTVAAYDDIEKLFRTPYIFPIPKTHFGKKNRFCRAWWFHKSPWFYYNTRYG